MRWSLCCLAGLLACAPASRPDPVADIALAVTPRDVAAGDSVVATLTTTLDGGVGYNLCTSVLERQQDDGWRVIEADRICTMELRTLQPGESARFAFHLPTGLAPGSYRYHARVERLAAGTMDDVRSGAFRVR